jgi:hypothetical protein
MKVGTGFRKTSCSNDNLKRDGDAKKAIPLWGRLPLRPGRRQPAEAADRAISAAFLPESSG